MADPAPTLSDAIYLAECHQDTGCLWRACDYGHQVRSGQLSGKQWDIDRLKLGVQQHRGVVVEANGATVFAANLITSAHNHTLDDRLLLDVTGRVCVFDC